jgi:hypothetical protein
MFLEAGCHCYHVSYFYLIVEVEVHAVVAATSAGHRDSKNSSLAASFNVNKDAQA